MNESIINCNLQTETTCVLTDGSGRSCKEYTEPLDPGSCTPFEATFSGKACNNNNRGTWYVYDTDMSDMNVIIL